MIPMPTTYMDHNLGAGELGNYEDYSALTGIASADIVPGQAVTATGDLVAPAADGTKVLGVAMSKHYSDTLKDDKKMVFNAKEPVPVMRSGHIWVVAGADVVANQPATVDANGNFIPATAEGATVVGRFNGDAKTDETVVVSLDLA